MPGSSSEDQLDAAALSGEQASRYIGLCRHGAGFRGLSRGAHAGPPHLHLQCLQEGSERLRRQKTNTLREDYATSAPSLFQEFVILN